MRAFPGRSFLHSTLVCSTYIIRQLDIRCYYLFALASFIFRLRNPTQALDNDNTTMWIKRRPRILLGVSGSVAAVKGPELALRLLNELDADVTVVLTRTGETFWNLSKDYNDCVWRELQLLILKHEEELHNPKSSQFSDPTNSLKNANGNVANECASHQRSITIHRKT